MADKKKEHKPLQVPMYEGENRDAVMAGLIISPELSAGMVAHAFTGNTLGEDVAGITELTAALKDATKRVNDGDLSTLEAMLVAQATYTKGVADQFALTAQDWNEAEQRLSRARLKQWKEAMQVLFGGLLVGWVLTAGIGWIARGFMGVPRGQDRRPVLHGETTREAA